MPTTYSKSVLAMLRSDIAGALVTTDYLLPESILAGLIHKHLPSQLGTKMKNRKGWKVR
jgi:hypothetical protein